MMINKKSTRDPNFYVFSHEHHHALVFATRLKKAAKAQPEVLKNYINHFWDIYLKSHFENEEKMLLPLLSDEALKAQLLYEHRIIKDVFNSVKQENENLLKIAGQISGLIKDHVKFEEKQLFPWFQEHLTEVQLKNIGKNLRHIKIEADDFSPAFWN